MPYHQKPGPNEYAPFYAGYVAHVPDGDIVTTLRTQLEDTIAIVRGLDEEQARHAYATGKWSIKTVIGHIADSERVLAGRALRFAREDATPLPGFDENAYAASARSDRRRLASLIAELTAVRAATTALFDSLSDDCWTRAGQANSYDVTVRALAWIIAGHELHHRGIIETRYLPTVP
jgi:uncharacterized damage-inducible protein DinB